MKKNTINVLKVLVKLVSSCINGCVLSKKTKNPTLGIVNLYDTIILNNKIFQPIYRYLGLNELQKRIQFKIMREHL